MYSSFFSDITNRKNKHKYLEVQHLTINFVDDSSSVISTKNHNIIKDYLEDYYLLLHNYYNINKLKINPDKNTILIVHQNKLHNIFKNLRTDMWWYVERR